MECMWLRLVATDRYLSLMLGLPQAVSNILPNGGCEEVEGLDRMERLEIKAAGMLLERKKQDEVGLRMMIEIDKLLLCAANTMPPEWWSASPDFKALASNTADGLKETLRVMAHFTHHHLLVQLHLPCLLRDEYEYNHSRLIIGNASRAILNLYVAFRNGDVPARRMLTFAAFLPLMREVCWGT